MLAAAAPSVAHAEAPACSLRVLEAPDDIRDALVGWASGETICHALDVRITPTGDGFSLWARADDGRTLTRWVADAKSAAVLVVRWAGDDTLPVGDPVPRTRIKPDVTSPMVVKDRVVRRGPAARKREVVVAMIANAESGEDVHARTGLRASIDLTMHGNWRVGIAGMLSDEKVYIYDYWTDMRVARAYEPRASAIGYITRSLVEDRVRLGMGAGFAYTQLSDVVVEPRVNNMIERVGIFAPAFELTALGSFPLSGRWQITGGVVITATGPSATSDLLKNDAHVFAPDHDGGTQIVGALGVSRAM
jgi:hypothetical protein